VGAKRIKIAGESVGGASLAISQCVIPAGGGTIQASTNRVAAGVRARLIAGSRCRLAARRCTGLIARAGRGLTTLICICIALAGR